MTEWSQNQVQRLTKMLKAGASFNDIARALSRPKNAVIGKAHRMGLKSANGVPANLRAAVEARKGKNGKKVTKAPAAPAIKPTRGRPEENRPTPPATPAKRTARPSDLIWHPKTCQFPEGDPRDPDFRFCGAPVEPADGRSYCPAHMARCYQPRPQKAPGDGPAAEFQMRGWGGRAA